MYYPIWLAYATGVLEQAGFNVKLVDAPAAGHDLQYILDLVAELRPRLAVLDTSTPSIYNDVAIAKAIKNSVPEALVVLVGPHVSALAEESLLISTAVDAVTRHEYEYTLRDLAQVIDGGGDLGSVEGLSYRASDGAIVHNPDRPLIADLDALPFVSQVYRQHLCIEDYFYSITRHPEITIVTGRGCPHRCTYCTWPQTLHGRHYRRRSPENVADEFEFIRREFSQVREIFIEDDTLTANHRHVQHLAEELIRRDIRIPFTANSRADVDYETLRLLKAAGCRLLCVGFESGDQGVLNKMHKGVRVEQFHEFRQAAQRAGILVHGCFMVGNPGETRSSMQKTLKLAMTLNPDTAQFFPLMVYPGTEAYEWARQNGYLTTTDFREWLTPAGLHQSIVSRPGLSAVELVAFCDRARRSFYVRPRYIVSKLIQVILHPSEAKRILRSAKTFVQYLFRPSLAQKPSTRATSVDQ
jgi:radical SAM superfamily enzyme YgiQ (UPF0313 family)